LSERWLGLERISETSWTLPVTEKVISGASALFGGCATGSAVVISSLMADQPVAFASSHFGALAKLGTSVTIDARVIASGRTLTHLEFTGTVDGVESFRSRVTCGARPSQATEGEWIAAPSVSSPDDSRDFSQPVHEGTWADRFEFRLADVRSVDGPTAAWWVRPKEDDPIDVPLSAAVLTDYVTYGIGRALGVPMGGLSIDNALRVHRPVSADWYLLQIVPEAINGGLGFGEARLFANGALVAVGNQSIVVNGWDWRLPDEA